MSGPRQGAGYISQEPLGRFCSFFAGKLVWRSRVDSQKFITLGSIFWILESFCITMATLSDFLKISDREDALCPGRLLPAKFRPDPSRNGAGAGGRGHKPYCFYCMKISHQGWQHASHDGGSSISVGLHGLYHSVSVSLFARCHEKSPLWHPRVARCQHPQTP